MRYKHVAKNWLYAQTNDYGPYFMKAAILQYILAWQPNGGDVTSGCAVTTRWHRLKERTLIPDNTEIIWNIWN